MPPAAILFVDDEEDIRFSFEDRFEDEFPLFLAEDGLDALRCLRSHPEIAVVVTDLRMPEMDGLALIKKARELNSDLGFIVVSGHGDAEDIIRALRIGARNYLRKPYDFVELRHAIQQEARRYQILKEETQQREKDLLVEKSLVSVQEMSFQIPSDLKLVSAIAFRLARTMEAAGVLVEDERANVVLAFVEIINNAIEHGNFGVTGEQKLQLKSMGENRFRAEIEKRQNDPELSKRVVQVTVSVDSKKAVVRVEDEGGGFDYTNLPDPTDPEHLFLPSGRGILMARTFLDEVAYHGKGNVVVLTKNASNPLN